jgi:acetylornithine deacetylase
MLKRAMVGERVDPIVEGMSAWTDAAILNSAGIPAICFGPGDISLAHAKEEFVAISEIEQATAVLTRMARDWLSEKT